MHRCHTIPSVRRTTMPVRRAAATVGRVPPPRRPITEAGAVSAEYAAVTACGVGLGGVLLKLLTSDWGQSLLKTLFGFFLKTLGIG